MAVQFAGEVVAQGCHVAVGAAPFGEQVFEQVEFVDEGVAVVAADDGVDEGAFGGAVGLGVAFDGEDVAVVVAAPAEADGVIVRVVVEAGADVVFGQVGVVA